MMSSPNGGKLLKLHARKNKTQTQQGSQLNLLPNQISTLNSIIHDNNDYNEKNAYLNRLKEEKELLLELLKEIQQSKDQLTQQMKGLELAKDAILSLRPCVSKDMIDQYLSDQCPLSPKNRNLNITGLQVDYIQEVYDNMLHIAAQFRLNQMEMQDFLMQNFLSVSESLLNGNTAQAADIIRRLEITVQANPRNIASAEELFSNIHQTVFRSGAEKFYAILNEELSKRY
jgi:hypothetical protein